MHTPLASSTLAATPLLPHFADLSRAGDFQTIQRGVGVFTERGGTIGWLVNADALVVVDTQYPDTAPECWEGLQQRTPRRADLVINTHHHWDHTGGNAFFESHTDRILAHANVPTLQRQAANERGNTDVQAYPNETFDATWHEPFGNETIRLRHYGPAHTGGDAVIHFERANVVHVGDLVFNRVYPFIDIDGGASTRGWIDTLEQIHADFDEDTRFIFGHAHPKHGVIGGRADLLAMRDFLTGLLEFVQQGMNQGQSIDAMAKRQVLSGFESYALDGWPISLESCLRAVHRDLTGPSDE